MVKRSELTRYLDSYLQVGEWEDGSWNGLQVEGSKEASKVIVGVTAGLELFAKAAEEDADYIIVHHGHFWEGANPSLVGWQKKRMQLLLEHDISLYAAHLPLDAHLEVGNNAELLRLIGAQVAGEFLDISHWGEILKGKHITEIEALLNEQLETQCKTLAFGPAIVRRVAVCTGGGGYKGFQAALEMGADLFITGDTAEIYHMAADAKINVMFAGHHATETLGVQALGRHIQGKFEVPVVFFDLPTGL